MKFRFKKKMSHDDSRREEIERFRAKRRQVVRMMWICCKRKTKMFEFIGTVRLGK